METEKTLKDKVPSRCYYYLLDFNEQDEFKMIQQVFNKSSLKDLDEKQFWTLFSMATHYDWFYKEKQS